jgi:electron transfer flavoprotein beta subunit
MIEGTTMVKIIVCVKQVLDPEAPSSAFQVDTEAKRVIPPKGVPPVLNPFDENALEAALRIKDTQDAEITVLSMGPNLAKPVMRKSLAVGADQLILLEDDAFRDLDSCSTAHILALAIKKIGECDLILCGREAADTDAGQVGSGIAEILGIPSITVIRKVEANNGNARVERVLSDGYQVIEAPMPVLVTASSEVGELRSAALKAILEAQKKPVTVWNAQELGADLPLTKRTDLHKLFTPTRREGKCEVAEGESLEEAGANLAIKLREAGMV